MNDAYIVSAVRDFHMYNRYIAQNRNCSGTSIVMFDNREKNEPIPVRYNDFLDSFDYSKQAWFIFCHEDFELEEPILDIVTNLPKEHLYGPVGSARIGFAGFGIQRTYGNISCINRDGSGERWYPGIFVKEPKCVETFDCCCVIVHSSLVKKHALRFDPKLEFDMYVEDFCAAAKVAADINSYVIPMSSCHHSSSAATERLTRHLPYLASKYRRNCFVGPLVYFGTPHWQKRIQDSLVDFLRSARSNSNPNRAAGD